MGLLGGSLTSKALRALVCSMVMETDMCVLCCDDVWYRPLIGRSWLLVLMLDFFGIGQPCEMQPRRGSEAEGRRERG